MPVKIISDSTCDLSPELLEKYDIAITPLTVTLGEKSGLDGAEITPEDIYEYVDRSGQLPKTSAVNIEAYAEVFRHWRKQGFSIVHFCISSCFSSTYQNACLAADEFEEVYVVDSRNLSTGQGLLVLHAAEIAQNGHSAEEIAADCRGLAPRTEASFVVNTLDYLYKGGRCSALEMFGANLLRLKPCIEVRDGRMEPGRKYRGRIDAVIEAYTEDRLKNRTDIDPHRIFVTHTRCAPQTVEKVKSLVREYCPEAEEIVETTAGSTITTHCGPECLGVLFFRRKTAEGSDGKVVSQ